MSLNMLPDGTPAPQYRCTAVSTYRLSEEEDDETILTEVLTEWWNEGNQVETIEVSAENRFYDAFDKASFKVVSIVKI